MVTLCLSSLDRAEASFASITKNRKELPCGDVATTLRAALLTAAKTPAAAAAGAQAQAEDDPSLTQVDFIRVNTDTVDALTNLAGEFALFAQRLKTLAPPALAPQCEQLQKLVNDLAFFTGEVRLVPLEQAFARFPRLVRDLAQTQKKDIRFDMSGTDVELDKTLVDHLASPLIHLLRNAVDHGIETPEERAAKQKPKEGSIRLTVERQQGFVRVTVADDGAPLDLAALKKIGKAKGFTDEQMAHITQENILDLLSLPGFSSSATVSDVSGRGVGLSAVREAAKTLGGQLTLAQDANGKRFTLSLPLQLSIIPAMIIGVAGESYALPLVHVRRLLLLPRTEIKGELGTPAVIVSGTDVPLLDLRSLFGLPAATPSSHVSIVLTESDRGTTGLLVDRVEGKAELAVKPVPEALRTCPLYTGSAILGSGRVALILDAGNLAREQERRFSPPSTSHA